MSSVFSHQNARHIDWEQNLITIVEKNQEEKIEFIVKQ